MYAQNGEQRIFYDVAGSGPTLVLLHGFGESGETWRVKGIVDGLAESCMVVLVDGRGHGASDKPYKPAAYGIERLVGDVVAVLNAAGVERCGVLGYSQGGWTALGMAAFARERIDKLAAGGATPYGQDLSQYRALCAMGLPGALAAIEAANGDELAPEQRDNFLANDIEALKAACASDRPDISSALAGLDVPCLLFAGEADPLLTDVRRLSASLPGSRCLAMPGLNHVQGALRMGSLLPELREFFGRRE